jgi:hypothetical protein
MKKNNRIQEHMEYENVSDMHDDSMSDAALF